MVYISVTFLDLKNKGAAILHVLKQSIKTQNCNAGQLLCLKFM